MADIPVEFIAGGFVAMGGAMGLLWKHFSAQNAMVRADLKERITALEAALAQAMAEIKELRHYERDRLFSLTDQAHMRERDHKAWMRRLARCAHCPQDTADIGTEAPEKITDPQPPVSRSSGFQPVRKV